MESSGTRGEGDAPSGGGSPGGSAPGGGGPSAAPRVSRVGFLLSQLGWSTAMRLPATIAPPRLETRAFAIPRPPASPDGPAPPAGVDPPSVPPPRQGRL